MRTRCSQAALPTKSTHACAPSGCCCVAMPLRNAHMHVWCSHLLPIPQSQGYATVPFGVVAELGPIMRTVQVLGG